MTVLTVFRGCVLGVRTVLTVMTVLTVLKWGFLDVWTVLTVLTDLIVLRVCVLGVLDSFDSFEWRCSEYSNSFDSLQ